MGIGNTTAAAALAAALVPATGRPGRAESASSSSA
ncbi:MAG: hypothetical protein ACRDRJ_41100 [Streptosporangiaceae bacterium]